MIANHQFLGKGADSKIDTELPPTGFGTIELTSYKKNTTSK